MEEQTSQEEELKENRQKSKKMTFKQAAKLGISIGAGKGMNIGGEFFTLLSKIKQRYWKKKYEEKKNE